MAFAAPRDPHETVERLARFLESVVGLREVTVRAQAASSGSGFANDTLPFDVEHVVDGRLITRSLVARIAPERHGLYPDYDLDLQRRVIDALGQYTNVPVPTVIAHDTVNPSWLGQPFFIMNRISGVAPPDSPPHTVRGWLLDAEPADRRATYRDGFEMLARIHATDWRAVGLGCLEQHPTRSGGPANQLAVDRAFYDWVSNGRDLPSFRHALHWMSEHLPETSDMVLSWGDARIGNILFREYRPVAVLDWEMAGLDAREADVAWWLIFDEIHTTGISRPRPTGVPSAEELVERYQTRTGHELSDLAYFQVRAAFRAGLLLVRYHDAMIATGALPADARRKPFEPALAVLRLLLDHQ